MDSGNSGSSSGGDDDRHSRSSRRHQPLAAAEFPNLFVTANTGTGCLFDPFLQPNSTQQQQPVSFGGHLAPGPSVTRPGNGMGVRSSKKRSRASRRAPTTVLTTDTSNFRAMVQEFTGIPAPPFSALRSANAGPAFNPPGSGSNYLNIHNPIQSFQSLLQQPQQQHQIVSSLEDQIQAGHQLFTDSNNSSSGAKFDYVAARCDGTVDSWICPPG